MDVKNGCENGSDDFALILVKIKIAPSHLQYPTVASDK